MRGLGILGYGSEGVGKTSWALEFDRIGPVTFNSVRETGYEDIIEFGRPRPDVKHVEIEDWEDLQKSTRDCKEGSFVVDTTSGVQTVLFDFVCRTSFNGDWAKFTDYWKGQRVDSVKAIEPWLVALDNLRNRGVNVILLGHMMTDETPNTMGADYKTHTIDVDKGIRAPLLKWAQAIVFMNIDVAITIATEMENRTKTVITGKAKDVDNRLMYVTKAPGHVAKNRDLFKKPIIQMGANPKEAFTNFYKALPEVYQKQWPLKEPI